MDEKNVTATRPEPTERTTKFDTVSPLDAVSALTIRQDGELVLRLGYNGDLVLGEGITLSQSAKAFWDAVTSFAPAVARRIAELEAELEAAEHFHLPTCIHLTAEMAKNCRTCNPTPEPTAAMFGMGGDNDDFDT